MHCLPLIDLPRRRTRVGKCSDDKCDRRETFSPIARIDHQKIHETLGISILRHFEADLDL
jgi:hypothetical protein